MVMQRQSAQSAHIPIRDWLIAALNINAKIQTTNVNEVAYYVYNNRKQLENEIIHILVVVSVVGMVTWGVTYLC